MALIPREFVDAVVAIGVRQADGIRWMATGFILLNPAGRSDDNGVPLYSTALITNRHVLAGLANVVLRFNPKSAGSSPVDFDVALNDEYGAVWAAHPDPKVDVAAMPINASVLTERDLNFGQLVADSCSLTLGEMKSQGVFEGDGVFVVGFPLGLMTPELQYAILRGGHIARIRDAYDIGMGSYLIDASIFPGNSGGPVFLRPEIVALQGTSAIARSMLIGVVHSYLPFLDRAMSEQTGRPRIVFEENSGLAVVEPVDRIVQTCEVAKSEIERRAAKTQIVTADVSPIERHSTAESVATPPSPVGDESIQ